MHFGSLGGTGGYVEGQASMQLMVRHRPMLVPEMALRLAITSKLVRRHAAKAEDLYVWDRMVRFGQQPRL